MNFNGLANRCPKLEIVSVKRIAPAQIFQK